MMRVKKVIQSYFFRVYRRLFATFKVKQLHDQYIDYIKKVNNDTNEKEKLQHYFGGVYYAVHELIATFPDEKE